MGVSAFVFTGRTIYDWFNGYSVYIGVVGSICLIIKDQSALQISAAFTGRSRATYKFLQCPRGRLQCRSYSILAAISEDKMSKVTLYSHDISPPCRSVLLVAHIIDLPLNIHEINLGKQDQTKDEFVKINPQRMIPAIDDNGFLLSDSHAIITYLVDKYAKNDDIYPKDIKKRALVNQHLFFDASVFFAATKTALRPIILEEVKSVSDKAMDGLKNAYTSLNTLLEGKKWLVGDSYTIADISCVVTATSVIALLNLDNYPNVKAWVQRCEAEIPGYQEVNTPGLNKFQEILRSKLG